MSEFDNLKALFEKGHLSRRDFLNGAAAIGAAAMIGPSVLGGVAQAATPKKGGTLRIGMEGGGASDCIDPRTYANSIPIAFGSPIWNTPVEIDEDGKATGELFESWEAKPGAKEWIFNVRKGIKFSSGKVLDADDMIYSINLHLGETKSPAKGILKQITEMKKLSADADPVHAGRAATPTFPTCSRTITSSSCRTASPTGPSPTAPAPTSSRVFEPGVRVALKNKGDYWKPNRGNFDAVEILYITDKAARTSALHLGQDRCGQPPRRAHGGPARQGREAQDRAHQGHGQPLLLRVARHRHAFDNKDIRLALKYGIDREKIIDRSIGGFATTGNDHTLDANDPVLQQGRAAAPLRSRQGGVPLQEGRHHQPRSSCRRRKAPGARPWTAPRSTRRA